MKYARWIATILLLLLLGACDTLPPVLEEETQGKVGCDVASYNQASAYGTLISTLGHSSYDEYFKQEVALQGQFFQSVPATVYLLDEGAPEYRNAYATADGYILFGYYMFHHTLSQYNELATAGVLAHEWGHRTQFTFNWTTQNPWMELEADAFSGYYMALSKGWAWNRIQGYYANVYATGDYYFNHPSHHGTPEQRLASAYLGVNTAILAMQNNRGYSYEELHYIFTSQIQGRIASQTDTMGKVEVTETLPEESLQAVEATVQQLVQIELEAIAAGETQGKEVTYPRKLMQEEILRLRPVASGQAKFAQR